MSTTRRVITQVVQIPHLTPNYDDLDRTETSRCDGGPTNIRRVQIDDSTDTDRDELVANHELYIYSSDDDSSHLTFRQQH